MSEGFNVKLEESLKSKLAREISKCKRCGFCNPVCPVGLIFDCLETRSPRGKLLLLHGLIGGDLKASKKLAESLYSCLVCGRCSVECPSGIKVNELIVEGREFLAKLATSGEIGR